MTAGSSVLVVANVTATSRQLIDALKERAASRECRFMLVVPPKADGHEAARRRLDEALSRMRSEGLKVDDGRIGDPDPLKAVMDLWDPDQFDEVVVSTLPPGTSKWLELDLPRRVEQETGAPVTHVVATGSGWSTFEPHSEPA
jgi:GABA permease